LADFKLDEQDRKESFDLRRLHFGNGARRVVQWRSSIAMADPSCTHPLGEGAESRPNA
jgi:hypothetical protein